MSKKTYRDERIFGIIFSIIFLSYAIYAYFQYSTIMTWLIILSILIFFVAIFMPIFLKPFNFVWIKFGLQLNKIASPIILGFIYFVLVFITRIYLLLFLKRLIIFGPDKKAKSYWIDKKEKIPDFKIQF